METSCDVCFDFPPGRQRPLLPSFALRPINFASALILPSIPLGKRVCLLKGIHEERRTRSALHSTQGKDVGRTLPISEGVSPPRRPSSILISHYQPPLRTTRSSSVLCSPSPRIRKRMESPNPDPGLKRKRSPVDEVPARHGHGPASSATPSVTAINYLVKARGDQERLRLIEGDAETFKDVLSAIDDYEGTHFDFLTWLCERGGDELG
jgi:hypothetical protein